MEATHNDDGTVTLTLTRAEAHVEIWGGKREQVDAVHWNIRHALVASEDAIPESDYKTMMDEVDNLDCTFHPDPRELFATETHPEAFGRPAKARKRCLGCNAVGDVPGFVHNFNCPRTELVDP
jgi:hypothetical protein